jgi:hypothetical protein
VKKKENQGNNKISKLRDESKFTGTRKIQPLAVKRRARM